MKYVTTLTLHHPLLNGKSAAQTGCTMEKHSVKMSVALPARPGVAKQSRLRIVLIDGTEGDAATIQWMCRAELCVFTPILCVMRTNTHQLRKCDCMACICSYYTLFLCVPVCFLVWVSGYVQNWLVKCCSGSEYKLGQHIKSSVSCWSGFTQGTAHSLNFPAFQLVYSGTCQASPPFEKPSACR